MDRLYAMFLNRKVFLLGSGVMMVMTITSYALGLLRDRIFAMTFGASRALDAYNAAFIVPDLILNILVASALSAAFVPLFTELKRAGDESKVDDFVSSVLNGALVATFVAGAIAWIFASQLSHLVVPGFDPEARALFVRLMRILLLSPLIFSVSNTFGNILVAREKFFWYGISAPLYNLGIIIGTLLLASTYGIEGVAVGTICGAVLHLAARLIGAWRFRPRYSARILFDNAYRRFLKLMTPKMLGQPVEQLTFFGFAAIASLMGAGSIAVLGFARNFQSMPVAAIGISVAMAAFPVLSKAAAGRNAKLFSHELMFTIKGILILAVPAALVMFLIRKPLIAILLGGGQFDARAIALTAATLGVFTLSIPTESVSHAFARAFYSLQNSMTPTIISLLCLGVAVGSGYLFSKLFGVPGLALGFVSGSLLKVILLSIFLKSETRKKLPH